MGKQIQFHMLGSDCEEFIDSLRGRDPIVITTWNSDLPDVRDLSRSACRVRETLCLWNQPLIPVLKRKYIPVSKRGPYYRIDDSLPVLEMIPSRECEWDGAPALTQGRIWGNFETSNSSHQRWYAAIVRWIRKNYARTSILHGYVAPEARKWRQQGGVLLPMFSPPVTPEWRNFVASQSEMDFL